MAKSYTINPRSKKIKFLAIVMGLVLSYFVYSFVFKIVSSQFAGHAARSDLATYNFQGQLVMNQPHDDKCPTINTGELFQIRDKPYCSYDGAKLYKTKDIVNALNNADQQLKAHGFKRPILTNDCDSYSDCVAQVKAGPTIQGNYYYKHGSTSWGSEMTLFVFNSQTAIFHQFGDEFQLPQLQRSLGPDEFIYGIIVQHDYYADFLSLTGF